MSSTAPSPSPAPAHSTQATIDAAKAPVLAYNQKNWDAIRASMTADCMYDEVATSRRLQGMDDLISCWQGWAKAFADCNATFDQATASGNIATLEVTWRGTHTGPLELADGAVAATNRPFEVRACQVCEISNGKVRAMRHYFDMATLMQQLGLSTAR